MPTPLAEQVARSLDAEARLLPHLPELLADLSELGTSAAMIVEVLRRAGARPGQRALDLGCGKGAAAVALAGRLGLHVDGVDGFAPFVEAARALAAEHGVSEACTFRVGDVRDVMARPADYDVVLLLSVGPVAGDHRRTVRGLRGLVRPGGLVVIDDAFVAAGGVDAPAYAAYGTHAATRAALTAWGDAVVDEVLRPPEATRAENERTTALIRARADRLKARRPELAGLLDAFVAGQEAETALLGDAVRDALWVLRRASA